MQRPPLSFWQIWNMSFGFLGIQFGWGLQMANMSAIYEYLGARPEQLAWLWIAAPLTGLIVQPIVGHVSDRTWEPLGRRRPYFLVGAILSSLALVLMPNSGALWMAVGLLWILDASINISMEPFRAFVADLLPEEQRTRGFAVQALLIGLGAVVSSALPWMMTNWFGVPTGVSGSDKIPLAVKLSFYIGAGVFFLAVLWTIVSTREYPPENMEAFLRMKTEHQGLWQNAMELLRTIAAMPQRMKQLAWVQMFTWAALFCMWTYFGVTIARTVFGAVDSGSPTYLEGIAWGGVCFSFYNGMAFVFAFVLIRLARTLSPKTIHTFCLLLGGLGLMSVILIRGNNLLFELPFTVPLFGLKAIESKHLLFLSMAGVGIAWASILSMPYAMLAGALPEAKIGTYMGVFNFFIVIPQILVAVGSGWVVKNVFANQLALVVLTGGVFMVIAALLVRRVDYALPAPQPVAEAV